jgi:hypothetical protein
MSSSPVVAAGDDDPAFIGISRISACATRQRGRSPRSRHDGRDGLDGRPGRNRNAIARLRIAVDKL